MSKKKTTPVPASSWYPRVGEIWPGQGIYVGIVRGDPGQPDHHLFTTAHPDAALADIAWGPRGVDVPGARSERDGLANTIAMAAAGSALAQRLLALKIDGHHDWHLPARRELRLLWVNAPELFATSWYWSSTQYSPHSAWNQLFGVGTQNDFVKDFEGRARAVRRLVIQ